MKVRLEIFEGPLDLLLYLIKKNHLDIYDIPIKEVCEQYLQYLEMMKFFDINIAGEYLLIAANLIHIKSKMLLPQPQSNEEEQEDPRQELVNKLLEYEKFKEAANFLKQKEQDRLRYISRPAVNIIDQGEIYIEASIFDLITAFKNALKEVPRDLFFEVIKEEFTIEQKVHDILHLLLLKERISLEEIFAQSKSKMEIVVTLLAILELIRLREIIAIQKELFSPIIIVRADRVESPV